MTQDVQDEYAIAIIGMAGRFPGADDVAQFWKNLDAGVASIRHFDADELREAGVAAELLANRDYVRAAGMLDGVEHFDAAFFGMTPREAELTDPQQRLFLETAWAAIEHAGYAPGALPGVTGIFAGMSQNAYFLQNVSGHPALLRAAGPLAVGIASDKDYLCSRVAFQLNLTGPAVVVQTGCSTSLVAVHLAGQSILNGECDMALAGGVSIGTLAKKGYLYTPNGIASRDGHCRPFDAGAAGTVSGDGLGIVVLKRLARALEDGDTVHAVIRGSAINNDGADKAGYTAPSVTGQAAVIAEALAVAGVDAASVSYIEAHGTATAMGDPIEVAALNQVFGHTGGACVLGSVKSNIGHLDAAAGVAGLIKTVQALRHRRLPATLHFKQANPLIDFASGPFRVSAQGAEWPAGATPRRAGVSSFGIGGSNAHVVLEEAPHLPATPSTGPQLLLLSARTRQALEEAQRRLAHCLRDGEGARASLADLAYTSQLGRRAFPWRRALACADVAAAVAALEQPAPAPVMARQQPAVAFLFPGQGAQYAGMGAELYRAGGRFRDEVDNCARLLQAALGLDLRTLLYPACGGEQQAARMLEQTRYTQPALFVTGYALACQFEDWGVRPAAMLGHSVGEYVAACLAGVLGLEDALWLVARRGALIDTLPGGAMLAVQADEASLRPLLQGQLWLAAVNGPAACSVAGSHEAVAQLAETLHARAIPCQPLRTSHAFHSGLLDPVLAEFERCVAGVTLREPQLPYLSNLTGDWITPAQATDPAYWSAHLRGEVRFDLALERLLESATDTLLELGPGVLCALVRQRPAATDGRPSATALAALPRDGGGCAHATALAALGGLWQRGVAVDWSAQHAGQARRRVPLPSYPFERTPHWLPTVAASAQPAPPTRSVNPADWLYAPVWKRGAALANLAAPRRRQEPMRQLVLCDAAGLALPYVATLRAAGHQVVLASFAAAYARKAQGYEFDPLDPAHYARLLADLQADGALPRRICHCWELPATPQPDDLGYHSLVYLAQALERAAPGAPVLLDVATSGLYGVLGQENLLPRRATLLGALRAITVEYPNIVCRHIDVERQDGMALAQLEQAWDAAAPGASVAWRGRYLWHCALERHAVEEQEQEQEQEQERLPLPLRDGGRYLITGGAGGIGAEFARYLAGAVRGPHLLLLGRSGLPERCDWEHGLQEGGAVAERIALCRELEAAGATVQYVAADVADAAALQALADSLDGPVHGVFHAAGVPGGALLGEQQAWRARQVMAAKVAGTLALAQVFDPLRLDFMLLCSSLNSLYPAPGQADYSAANAFLDAYAQHCQQSGCGRVLAVNWAAWQQVGMAAAALAGLPEARRARLAGMLAQGIAPQDGAVLFARLLAAGGGQLAVSPMPPSGRQPARAASAGQIADVTGAAVTAVHAVAAPQAGEEAIAAIWQDLFGAVPAGPQVDFFELGGQSLLAVQLLARVRQSTGVEVSMREFFAEPTIAALARRVRAREVGEGEDDGVGAIARQPRGGRLPLSWGQQRLWFLDQLDREAGKAYHMLTGLRLGGALNGDALQAALDGVVARHEALRTTIGEDTEGPLQRIAPANCGFVLAQCDLSSLGGHEQECALERVRVEEYGRPFDLAQGPLIRGTLLRMAEREHVLLLVQHHIVSDGWSLGVLVQEVAALYRAQVTGQASRLAPLAIQYADFALWQRGWLSGDRLHPQLEFWRHQLCGAQTLLALPLDRPRQAQQQYAGAVHKFALPQALSGALRELSRAMGTTLFMTLTAAWAALLARLGGQDDIVIGTPVANRARPELEPLIGFFANMLALRVRVDDTATVAQLLAQVRATALAAYDHQDLPFEQVVEAVKPPRSTAYSPIFQTVLAITDVAQAALDLPELRAAPLAGSQLTSKFDLSLLLSEAGGQMMAELEYASALFDAATVARLAGHLCALLEGMVADPQQPLYRLPLFDRAGRAAWTAQAATPLSAHPVQLLHRRFEAHAAAHPDATALVFEGVHVSYAALNRRANRLAHRLIGLGVRPDARVALCAERGPALLAGLLAILKAGGAYVPLDPAYPAQRLAYMLADSMPLALLADSTAAVAMGAHGLPVLALDGADADAADGARGHNPAVADLAPHHLAYVMYTSGSTGQPKGVMVEHAQVARLLSSCQRHFGFGRDDIWTLFHSYAFDFSVWEIWGALAHGGRLVVVPAACARSPHDFYRLLCEQEVTVLNQTPSAFHQLVAAQDGREHALRVVVFGGEALEMHTLAPWIARNSLQSTRLVNMYGITETTVHVTYHEVSAADVLERRASIVGKPLDDLQVWILDQHRQIQPPGVFGEMYIAGAGLARGYLGRPELTAQRFVGDVLAEAPGVRLYRSGDLARRLADGRIEYGGRNDFQVKVRGFRIELGEVEAALAALPGVRQAVVLAQGEAEARLVAYLIAADAAQCAPLALRAQLSAVLPEHLVPAAFVLLDSYPLTANGKLDRAALPDPDAQAVGRQAYRAPRAGAEQVLAAIWAAVLDLPQVGVDDNFFDLGGDSIRGIAVVAKARAAGLHCAVIDLFRQPTVAALARHVEQVATPAIAATASVDADGAPQQCAEGVESAFGMTQLQLGMVFHNQYAQRQGVYHDVFSYQLRLPVWNEAAFDAALQAMARRHPVLRTAFDFGQHGQPMQLVYRAAPLPLRVDDMRAWTPQRQDEMVVAFVERERASGFELTQAPLLRVFVHVRGATLIQYTMSFHHAILDGWSVAMFQSELFAQYARLLAGQPPILAPLALSEQAATVQERAALASLEQRAFWRRYLDGWELSALPQHGGAEAWTPARAERSLTLPPAVQGALEQLALRLSLPLRSVLLCAHMWVVSALCGRVDVLSGLVCNVRPEQADGDKVLGLFLNTLPFRIDRWQESWRAQVQATFAAELEVLAQRRYPYFQIVLENGRNQLFEIVFNFVNFHAYEALGGDSGIALVDAVSHEATGFPLAVTFSHTLGELRVSFDADTQRIGREQLALIRGLYEAVLGAIAADPEAAPRALPPVPPAQLRQIVHGWNDTARAYEDDALIHQLFERQAQARPDALALAGAQQVSYGELNRQANRIAHALLAVGVRPGARVAICAGRGVGMIAGLLGILKAGGAYVPLDPAYPADRLAYMLSDSAPVALLCDVAQRVQLEALAPVRAGLPLLALEPGDSAETYANPDPAALGLHAGHLAYIIYTSGSTGLPKGVMVQHRPVINLIEWVNRTFAVGPQDRVLFTTSFCFDLSVYDIFGLLAAGGVVRIASREEIADPRRLVAVLRDEAVTFWDSAPAVCQQLLPYLGETAGEDAGEGGGALRLAFFSGDWIPLELPDALRRAFPRCEVIGLGGATEATVWSNYYRVGAVDPAWRSIPYGKPIQNARYYVLNEALQPCPVGVAGDLYIGGACLSAGYYGRDELNAERYLPDPFTDGLADRIYRTGDRARYWADGNLEFLGRLDGQVKIRGFRVELGEIEARLARCAGVGEALVMARPDGAGGQRLVAYLQGGEGGEGADPAALRAVLAGQLPDYMLPSAFVMLAQWPLTPNGKVDRAALPEPDQQAVASREYVAPQGAAEQALALLWQELLGLERVGRDDHFFELGGHSLLAMQLALRIKQTCLVELPLAVLFEQATLTTMADHIEKQQFATLLGDDANDLDQFSDEEMLAMLEEGDKQSE